MSGRRLALGLGLVFAGGVVCGEASLSGLVYLWWVGGAAIAPGALLVLGSGALWGRREPATGLRQPWPASRPPPAPPMSR